MTNDLKTLKEAIDLMIQEVLGKFDFNYFKKIAQGDIRRPEPRDNNNTRRNPNHLPSEYNDHPEIAYAREHLPELSSGAAAGSSRCVFAYSGGKVLKIAMNQAGIAQNEEELNLYTSNGGNSVVTQIYDYSPDHKWLVAQLVKPLTGSEFNTFLGMSASTFENLIRHIFTEGLEGSEPLFDLEGITDEIESYKLLLQTPRNKELEDYYHNRIDDLEQEMVTSKNINKDSAVVKFISDIVDLMRKHKLAEGDIVLAKHYGRTVDGQIKLYDYGASDQVISKHYDGARYSDSVGSDEYSDDYTTGGNSSSGSRFGV